MSELLTVEVLNARRREIVDRLRRLAKFVENFTGSQTRSKWMETITALSVLKADASLIYFHLDEIGRDFCSACGARLPRPQDAFFHPHIHGEPCPI